jgi:hypothetical protein
MFTMARPKKNSTDHVQPPNGEAAPKRVHAPKDVLYHIFGASRSDGKISLIKQTETVGRARKYVLDNQLIIESFYQDICILKCKPVPLVRVELTPEQKELAKLKKGQSPYYHEKSPVNTE